MSKILLIEDPEDFLRVMEDLQDQYLKHLESRNSKGDLDNE